MKNTCIASILLSGGYAASLVPIPNPFLMLASVLLMGLSLEHAGLATNKLYKKVTYTLVLVFPQMGFLYSCMKDLPASVGLSAGITIVFFFLMEQEIRQRNLERRAEELAKLPSARPRQNVGY